MIAPANPRNIYRSKVLIGKIVTLAGKHPFSGQTATIIKVVVSLSGKGLNLKVRLGNGHECTVTEREHLIFDQNEFDAIKTELDNGHNGHNKGLDPGRKN